LAFARRCALDTGLCLNRDSVALREPRSVLDALCGIEGLFSGSLRPWRASA
jgi:hypothetical protein